MELGLRRAMENCVPKFLCDHCKDSDSFESKTWETVKKPKASAAQISKKAEKESKKKHQGLDR